MVVARRRVGNWRLYLDRLIEDIFDKLNFKLELKEGRKIKKKILPPMVKRFARSKVISEYRRDTIPTMSEEFVLAFQKR